MTQEQLDIECANCNSNECKQASMDSHRISPQEKFNQMMIAFWGQPTPPNWCVVPASLVRAQVGAVDCAKAKVSLSADENDHTTNAEVRFGVVVIPEHLLISDYDIPLFTGILDELNPDTFRFSKAMRTDDFGRILPTIAFQALANEEVVYLGDLSSQWPPLRLLEF